MKPGTESVSPLQGWTRLMNAKHERGYVQLKRDNRVKRP